MTNKKERFWVERNTTTPVSANKVINQLYWNGTKLARTDNGGTLISK